MTSLLVRSAFVAICLAVAVPALAQDDPVVAKVNGTEVRQSAVNAAEEEVGQNLPPMAPEAKQDYLVSYVIDTMLVSKAAEDKKLGDTPEFQRKLAAARNKLLMEAILQETAKGAVTDAAMRQVYDEAVKQMPEEKEVHARHILVENEVDAKAILADLKKGGDFTAIAKEKSKDPGSKDNGGDLGYFTKDQMVPEFADVAFKLDKGALSDPVKSQFGWHIIKVEDSRIKPVPEFDKVKDQLESYVQRKAQAEMIGKLRESAKIERVAKPADAAKPAEPAKK